MCVRVLTVDVQRDGRLQPLAGRHRTIPDDAPELGTVIFASRRQRQCAGRLMVFGAAAADRRLQRNGATFAIPAVGKIKWANRTIRIIDVLTSLDISSSW